MSSLYILARTRTDRTLLIRHPLGHYQYPFGYYSVPYHYWLDFCFALPAFVCGHVYLPSGFFGCLCFCFGFIGLGECRGLHILGVTKAWETFLQQCTWRSRSWRATSDDDVARHVFYDYYMAAAVIYLFWI
jgi:hypothetical protein